jgi:fatty-acyl-CoA synthase/long-chain acyl-CoA synthetase
MSLHANAGQPVNVTRLADLIGIAARRQPLLPALVFEGDSRSFGELYERSIRLARALRGTGLGKGDAVGTLMANRSEYLETYFALQLAGLVAVPINTRLVGDEVAYILGNSEAKGLVVGEEYHGLVEGVRDGLPELREDSVVVVGPESDHARAYERVLAGEDSGEPDASVSAFDPCSIFYTSGTTGFPKGAVMSQLNVLARLVSWAWEFGVTAQDVVLIPGPIFHMSFSSIALLTLAAGGRVILMKDFEAAPTPDGTLRHCEGCSARDRRCPGPRWRSCLPLFRRRESQTPMAGQRRAGSRCVVTGTCCAKSGQWAAARSAVK